LIAAKAELFDIAKKIKKEERKLDSLRAQFDMKVRIIDEIEQDVGGSEEHEIVDTLRGIA
jgi:hypothetical protein